MINSNLYADINNIYEKPSWEEYYKLTYHKDTEMYGPCIVVDLKDFNDLIKKVDRWKRPDDRPMFEKYCMRIFAYNKEEQAKEWLIEKLQELKPLYGEDELNRNDIHYEWAILRAQRFPGDIECLDGTRFVIGGSRMTREESNKYK